MFGLTNEKVIRKIDKILDELAIINRRVSEYEELSDLSLRMGASTGNNTPVLEWRMTHDDIERILRDAKIGLQFKREPFRQIDSLLPALKQSLAHFRSVLDETDQHAEQGRAAARKLLGL